MFQIINTKTKRPIKDAITRRPIVFESWDGADHFARSIIANWIADYRSQGRAIPTLQVTPA